MRRLPVLLMVAISVAAGLMAMVFAARWLSSQGSQMSTRVVVAAADIALGSVITAEHLKQVDWPKSALPAGVFMDPEKLKDRVARVAIHRDEPILESRLAPKGARAGLSAVISQGKRAITVRVNDVIGVAGFALPGNYVDVILSTKDARRGRDEAEISKIVLEGILVLAVGEEVGRDDTRPRAVKAVTLEVSPAEAEAIDLARSVGNLSLVLRNQVDLARGNTRGVTKDHLLGVKEAAPPSPPLARPAVGECVELFNGRQTERKCF